MFSCVECNLDRNVNSSSVEVTASELEEAKAWLDVQRRLVDMLQRAATTCFAERNQLFDDRRTRKYFYSSKTLVPLPSPRGLCFHPCLFSVCLLTGLLRNFTRSKRSCHFVEWSDRGQGPVD